MASPQPEKGHTQIANELLEAFLRANLSVTQLKICLWVMRHSYGWKRKTAPFTWYGVARDIGLDRSGVYKDGKELVLTNVLVLEGKEVGVQKDYDKWVNRLPISGHPSNSGHPSIGRPSTKIVDTRPIHSGHPSNTFLIGKKTKENKERVVDPNFMTFWENYPNKAGEVPALEAWNQLKPDNLLAAEIVRAVRAWKESEKWKKGYVWGAAKFLREQRWKDPIPETPQSETDRRRAATKRFIEARKREMNEHL